MAGEAQEPVVLFGTDSLSAVNAYEPLSLYEVVIE